MNSIEERSFNTINENLVTINDENLTGFGYAVCNGSIIELVGNFKHRTFGLINHIRLRVTNISSINYDNYGVFNCLGEVINEIRFNVALTIIIENGINDEDVRFLKSIRSKGKSQYTHDELERLKEISFKVKKNKISGLDVLFE